MNKNLTEEEFVDLIQHYKLLKSFLKVDKNLRKQGIWGFIPTHKLGDVSKFIKLFEDENTKI